jgi:thiaminase
MADHNITDEELQRLNTLVRVMSSEFMAEEIARIHTAVYPARMWDVNRDDYPSRRDYYDSFIRNHMIKEHVEEIAQILAIVEQRNQSQSSNQNQRTSQPNRFADIDIV